MRVVNNKASRRLLAHWAVLECIRSWNEGGITVVEVLPNLFPIATVCGWRLAQVAANCQESI